MSYFSRFYAQHLTHENLHFGGGGIFQQDSSMVREQKKSLFLKNISSLKKLSSEP